VVCLKLIDTREQKSWIEEKNKAAIYINLVVIIAMHLLMARCWSCLLTLSMVKEWADFVIPLLQAEMHLYMPRYLSIPASTRTL